MTGLPPAARPVRPLTPVQHGFWVLDQLSPHSGVSNLDLTFRTVRPVRWWPLHVAANQLLRRHPALRLRFPSVEGAPVCHLTSAENASIAVDMFSPPPRTLIGEVQAYARKPFDLAWDLPVRVGCFASGTGSVVCVVVHHICSDVISQRTLLEELCQAYDRVAERNELPPELLAETPMLADRDPAPEAVRYWLDHLDGVRPDAMVIAGARRPPPAPTFAGRTYRHWLSPAARGALRRLRGELRVTENIVMLAAFYLTLLRHGAGPDLVVGVPVRRRAPATDAGVGLAISTMALRVRADPRAGFRALARATRDAFLAGVEHADASVESVVTRLERRPGDWRAPIFRHLYNYRAWDVRHVTVGGEPVEFVLLDDRSRLDIDFVVVPGPDGVLLRLTYATEVHDEPAVAAFAERLDVLLRRAAEEPDRAVCELDPHTEADRRTLVALNATDRTWTGRTSVPAMIAARAAAAPDAEAVIDGARTITWAGLCSWSAAIRDRLAEHGAGPGDVVALALNRSAELAAAMLGVWAAGAAFLPLDARNPGERLAFQLDDAGAALVLTPIDADPPLWTAGHRVAPVPPAPPAAEASAGMVPVEPDDRAYLCYTSGTTGRPKAVQVSHRSLANLIAYFADLLAGREPPVVLWNTTPAFDISMLEVFLPLCAGGRVVVADDETQLDPRRLLDVVLANDVSVIQATPTAWRLIASHAGKDLAARTALCGGEPLSAVMARRLLDLGCQVFNVYGPTETTIWSAAERLHAPVADPVPVGRPIANTSVFIIDRYGSEAPPGIAGELCIAGTGVSLGYLGRDELTAERFGVHPLRGRYYRTGDMARVRADGRLEILGRTDRQVKLHGHRIELAEVEAVLCEHEEVGAAAVMLHGDPQGEDGRLLAFVQPAREPAPRLDARVVAYALRRLPSSAVPAQVVVVDRLPTTANGKVDHAALASRGTGSPAGAPIDRSPDVEPGDPELTAALVTLWRETLNRPGLRAGDSLFLNGGHSVLAVQLAPRIGALVGRPVPVRAVFDHASPRDMAAYLAAVERDGTG
ncbi:hypothetical protein GCM10010199_71170 [Dactylosporangium roseum]